jgi:3',5'-cyclic AMP phosphodiesterase CpdA
LKIVFVSDTHLTPRTAAFNDNWAATRMWISGVAPDLVVNLGDITAEGSERAEELSLARPLFDDLGCEVRFVPGNHDIGDNPIAPGRPNKHPLSLDRLAQYRTLFGPDRWTLDRDGWRLVALNAQLFGTDTDEEGRQFDWIDEQVRGHRGPFGLLLHKPLFKEGPADTEAHVRYVPAIPRDRLLRLLAKTDLRFVVSGHAHQSRQIVVDDVEHVWAPSTAFWIPDAMQERIGDKTLGVLTLELMPEGHRFSLERPPLTPNNLLDFASVYPELDAIKARMAVAS